MLRVSLQGVEQTLHNFVEGRRKDATLKGAVSPPIPQNTYREKLKLS